MTTIARHRRFLVSFKYGFMSLSYTAHLQPPLIITVMFSSCLFPISALLFCTVTTPTNQAVCTDLLIPVEITTTTFVPNFAPFNGSTGATNFILQLLNGYITAPFKGTQNNTSSFTLSAQYCTPAKPSARSTTLRPLTSGIVLDKTCVAPATERTMILIHCYTVTGTSTNTLIFKPPSQLATASSHGTAWAQDCPPFQTNTRSSNPAPSSPSSSN